MTTATETCPGKQEDCADKWDARTIVTDLELTEDEEAMLTAKAAQQGLTLEEYIRMLLGYQP